MHGGVLSSTKMALKSVNAFTVYHVETDPDSPILAADDSGGTDANAFTDTDDESVGASSKVGL